MEKGPQHKLFLTRLDRWDPDRVLTAGKQVKELMAQPGWLLLQEVIAQGKAVKERLLIHGDPSGHAQMAHLAGEIAGLDRLGGAAEAVLLKAQEIDEKRQAEAERADIAERRAATAERT